MQNDAKRMPDFIRILPFAAIHNFRDYGGYTVARGGRLRDGLLFRSAQHRDASADDLAAVAALGLVAIIDLRGPSERKVAPCPRPEGFSARIVMVDDETSGLAPHVEAARHAGDADGAVRAMCQGYGLMPYRPNLVRVMTGYFEALATIDGPTLIHCMAGKDRTGLAVALFHAAMGVHRDDIFADYMLTNAATSIEARIASATANERKRGERLDDASMRVLLSVQPGYLASAFAGIDERHGSLRAYLRDMLGVDDLRRDRIVEKLVA